MWIDDLGFKTLSEWLKIFPPRTDINIKIFKRTYSWWTQERLLESLPPEMLKSYVCNLEENFGCDVCLDVACYELEPRNDEKDEVITDLWEQLYLTTENSKRMERIFEEYKHEYEQR